MAEESENKKTVKIHLPHFVWRHLSIILIAVLAVSLLFNFKILNFPIVGMIITLTPQDAGKKCVDYINNNLVQTGQATLVSVEEQSGVYRVTTSYQGQQIPVYITKDGLYMFVSQPIDTSKEIPKQQQTQGGIPKTNKPSTELFVMSFCPYGIQAENLMKPVVDLLGTNADIKVRFIATVQGDTVDSVQSLHGTNEAKEDLRQICIMKYYDQNTYWNYLMEINQNCSSIYRDADKLDTCWKQAAQRFGIDTGKIETCAYGSEGLNLLKADEQLADQYGVTGSPTLIINGARYSGSRSSEAFKQAICSGFTTQPSECSKTLSNSTSSTASGGCG